MTKPRELPDAITLISLEYMAKLLWLGWLAHFGEAPKPASIRVLLAHFAFETGWGKACHVNNPGNAKHVKGDGRCWVYFGCDEILNGKRVWFNPPPPHEMGTVEIPGYSTCCFRGFETPEEGGADHFEMLLKNFGRAWPAVTAGDPAQFCHLLKLSRYYTADEAVYTRGVVGCYGSVRIDWSKMPSALEPEQQERVQYLVNLISAFDMLEEARASMAAEAQASVLETPDGTQ